MSVVIISAARFSGGGAVAERSAEQLGYRLIGREIVREAASRYGVSEGLLTHAIDGRPTWLPLPSKDRRACLAYLQSALSDHLLDDGCVCHGLAAHLYVTGISHVVKVRIDAPDEQRVAEAVRRRGVGDAAARRLIRRLDGRRQRWVADLYGVDESDPASFDLMIDRARATVEQAAAAVVETARDSRFTPMSYSLKQARDQILASKVRAALVTVDPEVRVHADAGAVHIEATDLGRSSRKAMAFEERARELPGVESVEITMIEDVFAKAAVSMR